MADIVIPDIEGPVLERLRERAASCGRTPAAEARTILTEALQLRPAEAWARLTAFRERLAASGRTFGDSAELLRADRDR